MSTIYGQIARSWVSRQWTGISSWNLITKGALALAVTALAIALIRKFTANSSRNHSSLRHHGTSLHKLTHVKETVSSDGSTTNRTYHLTNIEKIELHVSAELRIWIGNEKSLILQTAQSNIIDFLSPRIETISPARTGLSLILGSSESYQTTQTISYDLFLPYFNDLKVTNGMVEVNPPLGKNHWCCEISGNGKVTVNAGKVEYQHIEVEGNGIYKADNFFSDKAMVILRNNGKATIHVLEQLEANIKQNGQCSYYGNPKILRSGKTEGRLVPITV